MVDHDTKKMLTDRGVVYGNYGDLAELTQKLKAVVREALQHRGKTLHPVQEEALSMILLKIARVINGDSSYVDSWRDMAGYASLVEKDLMGRTGVGGVDTDELRAVAKAWAAGRKA